MWVLCPWKTGKWSANLRLCCLLRMNLTQKLELVPSESYFIQLGLLFLIGQDWNPLNHLLHVCCAKGPRLKVWIFAKPAQSVDKPRSCSLAKLHNMKYAHGEQDSSIWSSLRLATAITDVLPKLDLDFTSWLVCGQQRIKYTLNLFGDTVFKLTILNSTLPLYHFKHLVEATRLKAGQRQAVLQRVSSWPGVPCAFQRR